jgi:hypothetical protein
VYFSAVKNENIPVINYILKNEAYQADDYPGKFVIIRHLVSMNTIITIV